MKLHVGLLSGMVLVLGFAGWLRAADDPEEAKIVASMNKAKMEAARKTYEVYWVNYREGRRSGAETLYWWSRRWMEAERDLSDKKADRVAAYRGHMDRMRSYDNLIRELQRARAVTNEEITGAEYYRLEAELWYRQARQ